MTAARAAAILCSVATLALPLPAAAVSLVRGPYLQLGTPTSMVVRWRTDVATDTVLSYGPAPGSLTTTLSNPAAVTDHEVAIGGLAPDTKYFYEVGDSIAVLAGNDADHYFVTSPLPGSRRPIRIWVVGDSGQCGATQQGCDDARATADAYLAWVAAHGGQRADVWLMLGDNAYTQGSDAQYTAALFEVYPDILRNTVLWPVPGNHEFGLSDSPTQSGPYYEAFTLPTAGEAGGVMSGTEAYYSFDYGNVHFAALDSHDTNRSAPADPTNDVCPDPPEGGSMYRWLCEDLADTSQDWIFTYWHHPPYSKGSHDSDNEAQLQQMRERFVPVAEAHGGDFNLSGHSHSYERSILLDGHYGHSSTYDPLLHAVDAGDGDPDGDGAYAKPRLGPDPHQGAIYSVVGSSSKRTGALNQHPVMIAGENLVGSMVIDIDGSRLDAVWIDKLGVVHDTFRIWKGAAGIPAAPPLARGALALALLLLAARSLSRRGRR